MASSGSEPLAADRKRTGGEQAGGFDPAVQQQRPAAIHSATASSNLVRGTRECGFPSTSAFPCSHAPAPMASEAAPVATTSAQPVATEKSPAASGRYGLLTRSISMSYSCREGQPWKAFGGRAFGKEGAAPYMRQAVSASAAVLLIKIKTDAAQQPLSAAASVSTRQRAWLIPTIEMFISSAAAMACTNASSAVVPSCPGPRASADTLVTLTAVPSMVCGRENLVAWGWQCEGSLRFTTDGQVAHSTIAVRALCRGAHTGAAALTCIGHQGRLPAMLAELAGRLLLAARPGRCCCLVPSPPRLPPRATACSGAAAAPAAVAVPATAAADGVVMVAWQAAASMMALGLQRAGRLGINSARWTGRPGRRRWRQGTAAACNGWITCDPRSWRCRQAASARRQPDGPATEGTTGVCEGCARRAAGQPRSRMLRPCSRHPAGSQGVQVAAASDAGALGEQKEAPGA